jgi:exonuclease VII small subunit
MLKEKIYELKKLILEISEDHEIISETNTKEFLKTNIKIIQKKYETKLKNISTILNQNIGILSKNKMKLIENLDIDQKLFSLILSITDLNELFSNKEIEDIFKAINLKNKNINNAYIKKIQQQLLENDIKNTNIIYNKNFETFLNNILKDIKDSQKKELLEMFMEFNNLFKEEIFSSNISNFNDYIELISKHTFPKIFIPKENSEPLEYIINKSGSNVSDVLFIKKNYETNQSGELIFNKYETISLNVTKNPISNFEGVQNITHPIKNELIGYILTKYEKKGISCEVITELYTKSVFKNNKKKYSENHQYQYSTLLNSALEDLYYIKNMKKEFLYHQYIYNMNIEDILPIYKRFLIQKDITKDSDERFLISFFSKDLFKENIEENYIKKEKIINSYEKKYTNNKDFITKPIEEMIKLKKKFEFKYNIKHTMVILNQLEFISKTKNLKDIDYSEISAFIYMIGHLNTFFSNNDLTYGYFKDETGNNVIDLALNHLTFKSVKLEKLNDENSEKNYELKEIYFNNNSTSFENQKVKMFTIIKRIIEEYSYILSPFCNSFDKRNLMGDFLYISSRINKELKEIVLEKDMFYQNNKGILSKHVLDDININIKKEISEISNSLQEKEKTLEETNNSLEQANNSLEQANNSLEQANNSLEQANNSLEQANNSLVEKDRENEDLKMKLLIYELRDKIEKKILKSGVEDIELINKIKNIYSYNELESIYNELESCKTLKEFLNQTNKIFQNNNYQNNNINSTTQNKIK